MSSVDRILTGTGITDLELRQYLLDSIAIATGIANQNPSQSCRTDVASPSTGISTLLAATPSMEIFFSLISFLPSSPSSMPVPPMMNAALSAGRLYRQSPAFLLFMPCMWLLVRLWRTRSSRWLTKFHTWVRLISNFYLSFSPINNSIWLKASNVVLYEREGFPWHGYLSIRCPTLRTIELADRLLSGWIPTRSSVGAPTISSTMYIRLFTRRRGV